MEKNNCNDIRKFINNINIGLTVFPAEKDGVIEFNPLRNVIAADDCISFSVLLNIEYNEPMNKLLELNLIKFNSNNIDTFDSLLLESLSFNENNILTGREGEIQGNKSFEIPAIDFIDYDFKHTMRYSFYNVPLLGAGIYFISVGIADNDTLLPIKSVPINVSYNQDSEIKLTDKMNTPNN
ncbi:hypothetical protein [Phascolarctobacterium sp.]